MEQISWLIRITDTGSSGVAFCRETGVDISGVDFTVDVTGSGGGGIDFCGETGVDISFTAGASIGGCGGVGFCRETGIHVAVDGGEVLIGDAVNLKNEYLCYRIIRENHTRHYGW